MQARRVTRPVIQMQVIKRDCGDGFADRQARQQMTLGQQQLDAAVVQHVIQAFARVVRVQRHIGSTGLDDRQQAYQQLRRTLGADAYANVRADAFVAQIMRQTTGLRIQAGVVHLPAVPD